jgi:hypothetical protein
LSDIRADIAAARAALVKAEQATLSTVMIRPTGKIEVVDKEKLEGLNAEIETLRGILANNEAVIHELEKLLNEAVESKVLVHDREGKGEPTIRSVDERIMNKRQLIDSLKIRYQASLSEIIKHAPLDPNDIYASPEVQTLKTEYDNGIELANAELRGLEALWESVCAVRERFKPSGCKPVHVGEYSQAISRGQAGGMA